MIGISDDNSIPVIDYVDIPIDIDVDIIVSAIIYVYIFIAGVDIVGPVTGINIG